MNVEIEKRRHKRAKTSLGVRCASFGLDEIFVSRDVSGGGLFLNTPTPLAAGSDVELSFSISPDGPQIECSGRVVRSIPGVGMGIQFFDARGEVDMALNRPAEGEN
ncbi:MAG TPA: PilZ domain-containing protein [Terriglobia bacterium]|nr:PilZ domain-containing protein [Terriglobia bacterium]